MRCSATRRFAAHYADSVRLYDTLTRSLVDVPIVIGWTASPRFAETVFVASGIETFQTLSPTITWEAAADFIDRAIRDWVG